MLLSECRLGEVVINNNTNKIGHIIGLAENSSKEVITLVKLSDGAELKVHPIKLRYFK